MRSWLRLLIFLAGAPASAAAVDLVQLSLEELMEVEVRLVSRRPQRVAESAAAVTVITREELRRAGVRTLPDALRLVPGFQVGQVDANKWVVSARGFAGLFSNKLLVLIDGRSVYTPLFAGVFWESQHVLFEDVDRIEVIRGPGGTLWGTNSVNGIVNVVTREAAASEGLFVTGGGGPERRYVAARRGTRLGDGGHLRVYVERFARGRSAPAGTLAVHDSWHMSRAGLRADLALTDDDVLMLQANTQAGSVGQSLTYATQFPPPFAETTYFEAEVFGADLMARWRQQPSDASETEVQAYYDYFERDERIVSGRIHNLDLDAQHRRRLGRHEVVVGGEYRLTADDFDGTFTLALLPASRTTHLFSAFLHDQVSLWANQARLSLGAKVEHNSYSGVEWQPDVRLWWSPQENHALWAALSRAVRTPSRGDHGIRGVLQTLPSDSLFSGAPVALVTALGDEGFVSERVLAADIGYRAVLGAGWTTDITVFRNRYDDLLTQEPGLPIHGDDPEPHLVVPVRNNNLAEADIRGLEMSLEWQARPWWQIRAIYTFVDIDLDLLPQSRDFISSTFPGESPRHQVGLRSLAQLGPWSLHAAGRRIGAIDNPGIDAYATVDARVARQLVSGWEIAATGRNLMQPEHREAVSEIIGAVHTSVERELYVSLTWKR